MNYRLIIISLCIAVLGCNEEGGLLPTTDVQPETVVIKPDLNSGDEDTGRVPPVCEVKWSKALQTGGGMSHPAADKYDTVFVASGQKAYSLGEAGNVEWIWPDHDLDWAWPDDLDPPPPWELYTPALGRERTLFMGSNGKHLVAVNKNGIGLYLIPLTADASGAPAISKDKRVIVLADDGSLYQINDEQKKVVWSLTGDDVLPAARPGMQPVIGPEEFYKEEVFLALTKDSLHCLTVAPEIGTLTPKRVWQVTLPEGHESTSNPIMGEDGAVSFVTGSMLEGHYFKEHYLVTIPVAGPEGEMEVQLIYEGLTKVISLTRGKHELVIMGTENAGAIAYDLVTDGIYWHYLPNEQNFEHVAQVAQAADGLLYLAAGRHWLYAVDELGAYHWHQQLENPDGGLGAILWPSSPVVLSDGIAVFHAGNQIYAVNCSDEPLADTPWPRFGSNNRNTGRMDEHFYPQEETE